MKFELDVRERLLLLAIIPTVGNFATLKLIRNLREDLSFTEQENVELGLKSVPAKDGSGRTDFTWDQNAANKKKQFEIGETMLGVITEKFKSLDKQNRLSMDMLDLYEKFMDEAD